MPPDKPVSKPATDASGYLARAELWSEDIAEQLAARDGLVLSAEHWVIIRLAQAFYRQYALVPNNRVLVRLAREAAGAQKGSSVYLMQLFNPTDAAAQVARLAGLPKGAWCIDDHAARKTPGNTG